MQIMFSPPSQAAFSYHQPHILKSLTVLCAGRNDINACRIDTAVAEYVGKFGNVLLDAVERAGKKMSQVMGENFPAQNVCMSAKVFHVCPYLLAAQ